MKSPSESNYDVKRLSPITITSNQVPSNARISMRQLFKSFGVLLAEVSYTDDMMMIIIITTITIITVMIMIMILL